MPTPFHLAIVIHGGNVQGLYADDIRALTLFLLDHDNLCDGEDRLAQDVVRAGAVPERVVQAGLSEALAEYRAAAARQLARGRQKEETR